MRKNNKDTAVSEIIGTVLLLAVSVALFSLIYMTVLSNVDETGAPSTNIVGYVENNNIVFEHHGGESLTTDSYIRLIIGGDSSTINITSPYLQDTNSNGDWDVGEKIIYSSSIQGLQVETTIIDNPTNSAIFTGMLQSGDANASAPSGSLATAIAAFGSYQYTSPPLTISATSTGTNPDNVTLYYRWSTDNSTWTPQSSSVPVVEGNTYSRASSGTTCTINKPSGVQTGDLLIVICTIDGTGASLSGPSGFSTLHSEVQSGSQTTASWWKEATGSEPSTYSVTWSGSEAYVGSCIRISGADTSNPVDVSDSNTGSGYSTVSAPSVTTTVGNTLLLRFHGMDDDDEGDDYSGDNPSGTTELYAYGSTGSNHECSGACSYESQTSAGSTGSAGWTFTNYEGWAAFTVAIKPESSSTGYDWAVWSDTSNPDTSSPWSWSFDFPNGTGYYEFYSIGKKTGLSDETAPGTADEICYLNMTPPTVTTQDASNIGENSARLNMNYNFNDYSSGQVRFAYKKQSAGSWSYTTWSSQSGSGSYNTYVYSLSSDTDYVFKAQLSYDSTTIEGDQKAFTTDD